MNSVVMACWMVSQSLSSGGAASADRQGTWVAQLAQEPSRQLRREGIKDMLRRRAEETRAKAQSNLNDKGRSNTPTSAPPPSARPSSTPTATPKTEVKTKPAPKPRKSSTKKKRPKDGRYSFDFSKAEIVDIVRAISDITERNFIIPEKMKSQRLTILSPSRISANEAYQVFLTALQMNGITIVRSGRFYKLVESKEAIKQPIPTCVGPDDQCPEFSNQMVTLMIHINHIEANQVTSVLKGLVSKAGELTVFQPTNALILSEYAPNISRLRRIIEALDVPGFEDELRLVQIEYATASEIADKLSQVFEVQAKGNSKSKSSRSSRKNKEANDEDEVQISKIIADDRTNQIIIKANKRSFDAIKKLISRLDLPVSEADQGRVHVHYLENASAEDLSSTLSSLAQGSQRAKTARGGKAKGAEAAALFEGEIKVSADKSTNSLIIVASPRDFRSLRRIIEKLDVPRRQVYVEAAILEVTVNDDNDYGINWHAPLQLGAGDIGSDAGPAVGFVHSGAFGAGGGISPTLGAALSPEALLGIAGGSVAGIVGKGINLPVGDGEVTIPSFGVILNFLQTRSNAKVLSTPHILTTDNEEASIEVGQRIPFRRGTSIPSVANLGSLASSSGAAGASGALGNLGGLGNLFSSTDRIDVSLKLTLTPQINESDKIRLEIDQQIEDVVGTEPVTQQPITANRAAQTVVVVEDQQTIVIGGLMRDRTTQDEVKLPILGDLPLIGWLFKKKNQKAEKVNLMLVLTPYIIRDTGDFQRILERKMNEYEEFAAEYYGSLPEYRAHIDYTRKVGPVGKLVSTVQREMRRVENGGTGEQEVLVEPKEAPPGQPAGAQGTGEDAADVPADATSGEPATSPPQEGAVSSPPAGDAKAFPLLAEDDE